MNILIRLFLEKLKIIINFSFIFEIINQRVINMFNVQYYK